MIHIDFLLNSLILFLFLLAPDPPDPPDPPPVPLKKANIYEIEHHPA